VAQVKVIWTRLAVQDLDSAYEYIVARNPSAAPVVIEKIKTAVRALQTYPNLGRIGRGEGTRELVIAGTPFVIPYRVRKKRIEILALVHAARAWPESF
jgi:addiction module RelE/StbE family toxin